VPIIGLDVGEKRIGVARSDELNFMAHAAGFIERTSDAVTIQKIKELVADGQVNTIVVGLPITLQGDIGKKAQEILSFAEYLRNRIHCPIVTWDERLTTAEAQKRLLEQDVSRAKRRKKIDALAAEIMLQSYLDYSRNKLES